MALFRAARENPSRGVAAPPTEPEAACREEATVLITSYNQAAFLPDAIASARSQTVPCRIVMVDDGSIDGAASVGLKAGIDVIELDHQGAVAAFRSGIAQTETPYFCLLNGDDMLEPAYLERTLPLMRDRRVGFVYTGAAYFGAQEGTLRARPFDVAELLWNNFAVGAGASLVRRQAYESVGGFDRGFADCLEDWALLVAMAAKGWIGVPVDEPLVRYRRHIEPSRNDYSYWRGQLARMRLMRRHPASYLRHSPGVMAAAGRSALRRLRRRS